ncbi:MAG TPA: AmmeMemoRadiSam system radical SAM enzyme [Euryarchaeota archaeon]|nr:AmmeMemoRadiSam system radical SAM enzyme [Euryarchaeota archaeon]
MREAMFYSPINGDVKCHLCRHECRIAENKRGICGVRENRDGKLYSLVYGKAISYHVDPIEKKPLFHFLPGSTSFSFATAGCNFRCLHCQNWEISQLPHDKKEIPGINLGPEEIVELARKYRCESISYTYTEPTIFYEYAYDTAKLANKEGIKNIFVTNGYTGEDALREISPYLDAANIDLKGFTEEFYRKVCGAKLKPVLDNIKLYIELGIWIEVTTLLIPGYNDKDVRPIARFLKDVDENIPWHVTGFRPEYKLLNVESTTPESLVNARKIGLEEGLKHVYTGNVPGLEGENTYCPGCGTPLIKRIGFNVEIKDFENGKCKKCGTRIAGVF